MQFEIQLDSPYSRTYDDYSRYIYERMLRDIKKRVYRKRGRYRTYEDLIKKSGILKDLDPSFKLDLQHYISECIELVKLNGVYVIRINRSWMVNNNIPVSFIVRLVEYGTRDIPPLPLLRVVFRYYRSNYKSMVSEFLEERLCR